LRLVSDARPPRPANVKLEELKPDEDGHPGYRLSWCWPPRYQGPLKDDPAEVKNKERFDPPSVVPDPATQYFDPEAYHPSQFVVVKFNSGSKTEIGIKINCILEMGGCLYLEVEDKDLGEHEAEVEAGWIRQEGRIYPILGVCEIPDTKYIVVDPSSPEASSSAMRLPMNGDAILVVDSSRLESGLWTEVGNVPPPATTQARDSGRTRWS
jgi:hypothetical protein